MTQNFEADKAVQLIEKKMIGDARMKSEEQKRQQIFQYDKYDSEFMHQMPNANPNPPGNSHQYAKVNKSMVLSKLEVEKSLAEIYNYYARSYIQHNKEYSQFDDAYRASKLKIQQFLLFAKNFHILKTIFTIERLTIIFKKHADYGKYLSFDNFYFMIGSLSHEPQTKKHFNLESMLQNLDIETIEELQKQQFYNYLQLSNPERYRLNFGELFGAFNIKDKPRNQPLKYNYRKFSLPELRKKAIPQHKERKKGEKDLFILKNDKQAQNNIFDQAKSIVVSWDSLRAKSVNNLGKPSQIVQKKYLKVDPEQDPYLEQLRPSSKPSPRSSNNKRKYERSQDHISKIEQKIKQIEQNQNIKNKQILKRIQKKLNVASSRKLQI